MSACIERRTFIVGSDRTAETNPQGRHTLHHDADGTRGLGGLFDFRSQSGAKDCEVGHSLDDAVAQSLRARFPDLRLIICADDDVGTPGNPGLTKGREAALDCNSFFIIGNCRDLVCL